MNWGSDEEGDHPKHDADFEKKRTESQALLLEFQRQRAADTVVDKGAKRQQQANIGEVIMNLIIHSRTCSFPKASVLLISNSID